MDATSPNLPPALAALAATQGGVFLAGQAYDAGYDRQAVSSMVRRRLWHRLRRGAYADASVWAELDDAGRHRLVARGVLLRLDGEVALSHESAAVHHGLDLWRPGFEVVSVTRAGAVSSRVEAGVRHCRGALDETDCTMLGDVPVTAPARTAFDVARQSALEPGGTEHASTEHAVGGVPACFLRGVVVADAALRAGTTGPEELRDVVERCRDWPASRAAARALLFADGRSESVGESVVRCVLHAIGVPPDELQLTIHADGREVRVDFAWMGWRVVLEFDGRIKYGRLLADGDDVESVLLRERRRELAIEAEGWVVVRITWADLFRPEVIRRRVMEAQARAARLGLPRRPVAG